MKGQIRGFARMIPTGETARSRSGISAMAIAALVAAFALLGFAPDTRAKDGDSVTVQLDEQNGSGLSGTATLTAQGDQTLVVISAPDAPEGTTGHIFDSNCEDHASATVFYDFTPLDANGGSETVVDQTFAVLTSGDYWVHLHKSGVERGGGLLCGNVPDANAPTAIPNTGVGTSLGSSQPSVLLSGLAGLFAIAALILRARRGSWEVAGRR